MIRHAIWLDFRFTLSFRDVEEVLAQRGVEVSYETIRCWTIKFGPQIARNLKRKRPAPSPRWHVDEVVCNIDGKRMYCGAPWTTKAKSGGVKLTALLRGR